MGQAGLQISCIFYTWCNSPCNPFMSIAVSIVNYVNKFLSKSRDSCIVMPSLVSKQWPRQSRLLVSVTSCYDKSISLSRAHMGWGVLIITVLQPSSARKLPFVWISCTKLLEIPFIQEKLKVCGPCTKQIAMAISCVQTNRWQIFQAS